jgi:peptidoglycan/LPS O-acetylase OafA/YrhL
VCFISWLIKDSVLKYRAEIDGLRALAVVPVILFHAGFELFSGGFVGVDVFFVISGYLITTILIGELEDNRFSIVNFYERRARRILPALFFIMIVCVPFAWMWMLSSQFKDFSQSLVAVSFFVSNILFWRESGYFAPAAEEKPLLHTWSLAVEEQYYILFPIFLLFAWRYGKNKVFWMIVAFSAVSLALSEWGWRNNPAANFYLAPTRAWELFAGSIAAFIVNKHGVRKSNVFALLGLAAILYSIFKYDESTPFPSVYALVPVLGVVLLVLFADKETLVARVLSTKVFVGIGLISYSAYLWHHPLFAFARIRLLESPPWYFMLGLSVVSLFLAALTWKFVEAPFRNKHGFFANRRTVFSVSGVTLFIFAGFGLMGHINNGFSNRMPAHLNSIDVAGAPVSATCLKGDVSDCVIGEREGAVDFALIGDSHAGRYAYALEKQSEVGDFSFRLISGGWCAPLINWSAYDGANNTSCFEGMENLIQDVAGDDSIKTVVLAAEWANYTKGYRHGSRVTTYQHDKVSIKKPENNYKAFSKAFDDTVDLLLSKKKRVIIIEPVPEYKFSVPKKLAKAILFDFCLGELRKPLEEYYKRNEEFFDVLDEFDSSEVKRFSVSQFFCDSQFCRPYSEEILPYYNDGNHLSSVGLELLEGELLESILAASK